MFYTSGEDYPRDFKQDRGENKLFLMVKIDMHRIQKSPKVNEGGCVSP